jgi:hypothetical protein
MGAFFFPNCRITHVSPTLTEGEQKKTVLLEDFIL